MSAYTTIEIKRSLAINFLIGKVMTADNQKLEELMDCFGDDGEPYYLNNFNVISDEEE